MTIYIHNDLRQEKLDMPLQDFHFLDAFEEAGDGISQAASSPSSSINLSDIIKTIENIKDIDWSDIVKAITNKENDLAVLTTLEDIAKIASPFIPQAAGAAMVLGMIIFLIKNTSPSQPNSYPGYHWDVLEGWVPDEEETK